MKVPVVSMRPSHLRVLFAATRSNYSYSTLHYTLQPKKVVIHNSDAGADDFVTSCLLARDPSVHLQAICITNADCVPQFALSAHAKLVQFLRSNDNKNNNNNTETSSSPPIPFGLSSSRCFNTFPWKWRADTIRIDETPSLNNNSMNNISTVTPWLEFTGDALLESILEKSAYDDEKVYIVATGPLTTLASVFERKPALMDHVAALHWMGGALDVPGNVEGTDANVLHPKASSEKAEWNAFADAFAVDWILKHAAATFDIHIVPLDVCNHAKLTTNFLEALRQSHDSKYAQFVFECYQSVSDLELYHMWDVVTAATLTQPELFEKPTTESLRIQTCAEDHGALRRDTSDDGRKVLVYKRFKNDNVEAFRQYVLKMMDA